MGIQRNFAEDTHTQQNERKNVFFFVLCSLNRIFASKSDDMRRFCLILFALLTMLRMQGQEVIDSVAVVPNEVRPTFQLSDTWITDSLHLPVLTRFGQMPYISMYPYMWGGYPSWNLHEGLNMSLGASVFTQFGKNAYHGAGFTQDLSMMYATPITKKLSIAVGGYMEQVSWAHDTYRDGGLNAVLSYRFDEHWEGYLYGQKSLVSKRIPLPLYGMSNIGDRIGAAVRYNFSPSFSIQVNVEKREMP